MARGAKAEVAVALDAEVEGVPMRVQGRIDGLLQGPDGEYTVQEIKSTRHNPRYIRENDNPVHWAQAEIYAYLFARLNNLARISVMLTYVNSADGEASFTREHTQGELEEIFLFHAGKYARWLRAVGEWQENCRQSARAVRFPHANYRKGQRRMAKNAYLAIRDQKLPPLPGAHRHGQDARRAVPGGEGHQRGIDCAPPFISPPAPPPAARRKTRCAFCAKMA